MYHVLKPLNHEFVAIATELQQLTSVGVYHAGMMPPGTHPLPGDTPFRLDPPLPRVPYQSKGPAQGTWPCRTTEPIKGMVLGLFGPTTNGNGPAAPTHVFVVNLDYKNNAETTLVGPGNLEIFDGTSKTWSPTNADRVTLKLLPGGGKLVRLRLANLHTFSEK
jgi:hypothetical protein